MTSDTQLGRSVLESKERTELQAIAEQLSVKTTSRMKKADLISEILTAAGVGEAPAPAAAAPSAPAARPARVRAPETPAEEGDDRAESSLERAGGGRGLLGARAPS